MKDLKDQKYNRLTILEKTSERKQGCIVWKCLCDCGNICYVPSRSIISGNTKSCGCLNKEKKIERIKSYNKDNIIKDISNNTYGNLIALYDTNILSKYGIHIWHCKCQCGNECDIPLTFLTGNKIKSCGCLRNILDIENQKFGCLTALYSLNVSSSEGVLWRFKCDCGQECDFPATRVKSGRILSCGCKKSKGEKKIEELLLNNGIKYEKEKTFEDCRFKDTNYLARFDFYLPEYNILIEYDGKQHFIYEKDGKSWNNESHYLKLKEHDEYKNNYCIKNNLLLIRIPYTHYDSLSIIDLLYNSKYKINVGQR